MSVQLADKMTLDEFTKWLKDDQSFRQDMIDSICSILDADWAPLNRQLGGYRVTFKEMPERARTVKAALEQSVEHEASMSMLLFQLNLGGAAAFGEHTLEQGLPEIRCSLSRSPASVPENHQPVKVEIKDFGELDPATLEWAKKGRCVAREIYFERGSCNSEQDVASIVQLLIEDVIRILKLPLRIAAELQVFEVRPDLWVIFTANMVPIGAVEVKKPSPTAMNDQKILGELRDQMEQLRHFYGATFSIGILTTGNEFRVCWYAAEGASEDKMNEMMAATEKGEERPRTPPPVLLPKVAGYTPSKRNPMLYGVKFGPAPTEAADDGADADGRLLFSRRQLLTTVNPLRFSASLALSQLVVVNVIFNINFNDSDQNPTKF
eukprot:m.353683 g.353683  ORF g.353683 m.353683 type:complete len:379 (+) comp16593_c2_seq20:577-1713(+)